MGRVILIVLDSVGIGHAPDAAAYGDVGSNTIGHVAKVLGGLHVPHLASLGLGKITEIEGVSTTDVHGAYGMMAPQSAGKDTTNGHMEFVGVTLREPLPTYPNGFPKEIMEPFEHRIGRKTLGNYPSSGTVILDELGEEHLNTGFPIVYTSGDSVFQLAAHEDVISVSQLYEMCAVARSLLVGEHAVGRVIARPFTGTVGHFARTANRRDFSRDFGPTLLTHLTDQQIPVIGIGKIEDIYGGQGITRGIHTQGNDDGINQTLTAMEEIEGPAFIFTNLVDFDMLYGHRNDPLGFGRAIEAFDRRLPELLQRLQPDDILLISADHGCDPTTPSTDHSRECVPIIGYYPGMMTSENMGTRSTYADIGATIADFFNVEWSIGTSFYEHLRRN
ncbi:MAG: phosphopentomutase [Acidibacillus sp.]|uniref:Phosphopentomutase n=1 Tax=Sulfoacidibacillus ferrooxidans TaxID=2005001 RepID=A0A9X2ACS0_9BACL|nr:phosphopentomutase [Sulfoacidibacillus ferrooxidans]MCI0184104.1 Phosphopentomutase [Sulfoacidibacillus ferrooxidans]MCY0893034.1 phosphopentomutase [Acidibacillus sp.]